MRFANNILKKNHYVAFGYEPCGQLSGIKKLLAKGGNGKFWAKDFDIKGHEMVGLSYLEVIKPTGVTKEVDIVLYINGDGRKVVETVTVHEWELTDYDRLAKAYELIMALITL